MSRFLKPPRARHDVDMTEGSVFRHLLYFALPLLAGNIFQQLYNTVDTWVVGNYVGHEAFSAVGTVGPVINMLIGAFIGLSSGASVVISQYYGAKNFKRVHDTVHTAIVMTFVMAVVFSIAGILLTPAMLRMMKTPADVFPEATTYLIIYFAGLAGLMFYNICSGILRAVGDSKRPFYFLVVAAVINTVLDLLFVIVFKMGVDGVAYATIIAQGVSAVLVLLTLLKTDSCVRLNLKELHCDKDMLKKIIQVGIPAGLQMAITAFSNIFVQSYINQFGSDCMGGWTARTKLEQFIFMPTQSVALATTTFVGQNLGVGQVERAQKGVRVSLIMSAVVASASILLTQIFASPIVSFFNEKPEVVEFGVLFIRCVIPFQLFTCVNQVYSSALRGAGNSRAPMLIMLLSFVAFRQVYLFIVSNFISNTPVPLAMGYPAGWVVCSISLLLYYHHVHLTSHPLVVDDEPNT